MMLAAAGHGQPVRAAQSANASPRMPVFEVDPSWPKLPNNWVVGTVSAVATDRRGHNWILHRPATVPDDLKARSAPPVVEFDANGQFVNAWGGPGPGYDWPSPRGEHGISVDHRDNVWITGNMAGDHMLLKFTNQGKFLRQIGGRMQNTGNADTDSVNLPADIFVYAKTNEAFVADGYGNRRIIVFDPDTGVFKRMWGAFGNPPDDGPPAAGPGGGGGGRGQQAAPPPLDTEGPGSPRFGNPLHAVKVSNDGLVYVGDRNNRRVQVFTTDGKYVTQVFINRGGPAVASAAGLGFSPDQKQQFLYVADYGNSHVVVLDRRTLRVLYQFGAQGSKPGDFQGVHHLAVDSKGNLYTAEVNPGNRAQRFLFKGLSATRPPNAVSEGQLSAR
jgi:DNA-binding beta-propeller fold protein YncE